MRRGRVYVLLMFAAAVLADKVRGAGGVAHGHFGEADGIVVGVPLREIDQNAGDDIVVVAQVGAVEDVGLVLAPRQLGGLGVRRLLGEPGFLALDDAFLTSDAGRREALASAFVELAEEGWQILYFTFDAALRDRLAGQGARVVELPAPSRARDTSAA